MIETIIYFSISALGLSIINVLYFCPVGRRIML